MKFKNILYQVHKRVAYITLNRPEKVNAMSWALRQELYSAFKVAERDSNVGCIVIKGAGDSFCAGYDLTPDTPSPNYPEDGYVASNLDDITAQYPHNLVNGWWIMWDLLKPVIAQVHGYCLAGGSELASMCDIMFVAEDATLGYPPVRNISPPDTVYFPWKLPMSWAKYLMFTGRGVTGVEAVELGWATKCFPAENLEEMTCNEAEAIATIKPDLLAASKRSVNRAYEVMGIKTALEIGADWQGLSMYRETANDFYQVSQEQGLKAAVLKRDGPFGDYSAKPKE